MQLPNITRIRCNLLRTFIYHRKQTFTGKLNFELAKFIVHWTARFEKNTAMGVARESVSRQSAS